MAFYYSEPSHTFSEYLLIPGYTAEDCVPANVSLRTPLTRFRKGEEPAISLNIPMVSAIMQSVSDDKLAIALAKEGGLSFIYGAQSIESEAAVVARVKNHKAGFVVSASNLTPDSTLADVLALKAKNGYSTVAITDDGTANGRLLGIEDAFLGRFIDAVNDVMGEAYPNLVENAGLVKGIVNAEEERFSTTLNNGRVYLDEQLGALAEGEQLSGKAAFMLHDTFGFPIDLTVEIAESAGHAVDIDGFDAEMAEQKARARAAAKGDAWGSFNDVWTELADQLPATEFAGYEEESIEGAHVLAIVVNGERVASAENAAEASVVLDRTPLYAEMGGQLGDHGLIDTADAQFFVSNTVSKGGLYVHEGKLIGKLSEGDTVFAGYDLNRRGLLARNHTATHLLDAALKEVLGEHVNQAGSLVSPEALRFDFTHFEAMISEQIRAVEDLVNEQILAAKPVVTRVMGIEEAKASGAVALFGEKYGDTVRVVDMGQGFSVEFCGGTHLDNTAKAGPFRIKSEGSVASGVRRIEATVGRLSLDTMNRNQELLFHAAQVLKTTPGELAAKAEQQAAEMKELRHELEKFKSEASLGEARQFLTAAKNVGGLKVLTAIRNGMDANALRQMGDFLRDKAPDVVAVLASANGEKITFLAVCGPEAVKRGIKAGDLVKSVCAICGGKGGGKPDSAMGGGSDLLKLDDALATVDDFVAEKLK